MCQSACRDTLPRFRATEGSVSRDEKLHWPRTTHDPFAGAWEEILALIQAHPEWKNAQLLHEIGHQTPERAVSLSIETLMHGLGTIRPHLGADWEDPWLPELIQGDYSKPFQTEPRLLKKRSRLLTSPRAGSAHARTTPRHIEQHHQGARGRSSCPVHS